MALTDHDTQAASPRRRPLSARPDADPGHRAVVPAGGRSVHLLAYLFDPADADSARRPRRSATIARTAPRRWPQGAGNGRRRQLGASRGDRRRRGRRPPAHRPRPRRGGRGRHPRGRVHRRLDRGRGPRLRGPVRGRTAPRGRAGQGGGRRPGARQPPLPGLSVPDEVIAGLVDSGLCGIEVFHLDHDLAERTGLLSWRHPWA